MTILIAVEIPGFVSSCKRAVCPAGTANIHLAQTARAFSPFEKGSDVFGYSMPPKLRINNEGICEP